MRMRVLACVVGLVAAGCVAQADPVDELYEECRAIESTCAPTVERPILGSAGLSLEEHCDLGYEEALEPRGPEYSPDFARNLMASDLVFARCFATCCPVDGVWNRECQLSCRRPHEVDRTAERCEQAHQACCEEHLQQSPHDGESACVALGRHGLDAERQACGEMKAECVDHFGLDFGAAHSASE